MPAITIVLPDVYETIIRSVAVDAVKQLSDYMMLAPSTKVYLPGRSGTVPMNDGVFGNCDNDHVYFDPKESITINYEEVAEDNFALSTAVWNKDNYPIFVDEPRDIVIRPVRRFVDFRLDFTLQTKSVVEAQQWIDNMRQRFSAGAGDLTLELNYHYNIPRNVLGLMKGLYDTMEKSAWPTGLSFQEYLTQHWTGPVTDMATLAYTNLVPSIYEKYVDAVGHFDFTGTPPTPTRTSDGAGTYEVSFSYVCRYERPTHLWVKYPMIMNQCPIPQVFRPKFTYKTYRNFDYKTTMLRGSLEEAVVMGTTTGLNYIQYPDTDDWVTENKGQENYVFFTGLLTLDCENPYELMDFRTLGRFSFTGWWLEFFYTLGEKAFKYPSWFNIRIYKNDQYINIPLHMEQKTLKLTTTAKLDPNYYYHIQIGFNTNLYTIPRAHWECIRRYPTCCWQLFNIHRVGFGTKPIEQMELIGLGRDRIPSDDCPGEGTTDYIDGLDYFPQGLVKWRDIDEAIKDKDKETGGKDGVDGWLINNTIGPLTVLWFGLIADKRKPKDGTV